MGINISRQPPNPINDILKPYNIKEKNSNYLLYENQQTKHQIEKWSFQFSDEESMKKKEKNISIQKILNCPSHLTIIAYQAQQIPEFCFTQYSVQVLCEHPIQDFQTYLEGRGQNEFSEAELWHLIDCMSSAQKNEYFYLDVMNIYQATEDVWKIRAFEPNESPILKYAHNLKVDQKNRFPHMYPSPEELKTLNPSDESKKQKSTVFTFGMLLLHLALATPCDSLYQNQQIDENGLNDRIKQLQQNYNPQLAYLIQNMLIFNLIDRYDYLQIGKQLQICNKSNYFEKEKQSIAHYTPNQPIMEIKPQSQLPIQVPSQYYQLASPQTIQNNSSVQQYQSVKEATTSQQMFYPTQQNLNYDPLASNNTANFQSSIPKQQPMQNQSYRQEFINTQIQNNNLSFRVSQVPEVNSKVIPSNYHNHNLTVSQLPEGKSNYIPSQFVGGRSSQNQPNQNKLQLPDGKLYEGSISENRMNGRGKLFYPNGELCYEGNFLNGNFHDYGIHFNQGYAQLTQPLSYQDLTQVDQYWTRYEGDFREGLRDGIGSLNFSNGEQYIGKFTLNFPHGTGTFYNMDKQSFHGVWEQGKIIRII